ncbi:MAG: methyl-accepting chemotaxis protein [Paraglaciecola sp.]|uniref:methyl-accepting chemotaxis protein n=1 Tax=Paraglaciecola sp. TaxID=1920173 RepID=UPI0032981806
MTKVNRLFLYVLIALLGLSVVFGLVFGTLISGLVIGLPALLVPLFFYRTAPDSTLSKHITAAAVMVFAALHIHQANGLIEVHFEIFILIALLIVFKDWKVFLTAIVVIAVHHLSFYFLQVGGAGVYIFDADRLAFTTVLIHAAYAVAEAVVGGYLARLMLAESKTGNELARVVQALACEKGLIDLKPRTHADNNPTLTAFNELLDSLSHLTEGIKTQVNDLNNNAKNLGAAKNELEESSEQRHIETDTIASSTEELSMTVASIAKETSELTTQMNQATEFTQATDRDVAEINSQNKSLANALQNTSNEVGELANSTETISTVLTEITGIADQTNLLALNAAIEAARAGEQGRGFAVVADEVRALANRTKQSTDKINETILLLQNYSKSSTESMEASMHIVHSVSESASKAKQQITDALGIVERANDISMTVAAAIEEQSVTTDSIAKSTETLRATAQVDNENVKTLDIETNGINDTANKLAESVSSFK